MILRVCCLQRLWWFNLPTLIGRSAAKSDGHLEFAWRKYLLIKFPNDWITAAFYESQQKVTGSYLGTAAAAFGVALWDTRFVTIFALSTWVAIILASELKRFRIAKKCINDIKRNGAFCSAKSNSGSAVGKKSCHFRLREKQRASAVPAVIGHHFRKHEWRQLLKKMIKFYIFLNWNYKNK